MRDLEDIVGDAVRDLAEGAPNAHDLAAVARLRGRRIRHRRRVAVGAAALALVVAAAAPFVVFRPKAATLPTTPTPAPSASMSAAPGVTPKVITVPNDSWWTKPYRLPGGAIVTALTRTNVGAQSPAGKTVQDGNVVLDRATGRYWALPWEYYEIWGAPAGPYSMVSDGSSHLFTVGREGDLPKPTDARPEVFGPQWSADGKRLVDTVDDGYVIRDLTTRRITKRGGTGAQGSCPDYCFFTWLSNGKEVAIARIDPDIPQSEARPDTVKDVVVYSVATGQAVRTLPVPGIPVGQDAWSPDDRFVLAFDNTFEPRPHHVIDVSSGVTVARIPGNARFLPDGRILSIRNTTAELYDTGGTLLETQELPADFADRTVSIGLP